MADTNNFSEMNENFDTIKTLLNTIRAQGILNTSDVDKLLEGINSKLEKINTEEDIDLIKAFLSELKKNLDERHEVLISKFGAIEALFSNLLKNSSDTVKSEQLKELFDIIATNLSVFSREVVDQKEKLENITLRLDAMRSDDSQKKDIIKSVSTVRNDIEKLNNGFDSIVISLNENFKTVLKTIAEVDQSEAIKGFSDKIADILDSTGTILSAIQLIDKKNNQFEDSFGGLATEESINNIRHELTELSAKSSEIKDLTDAIVQKSYKIDNLADKIDASVNIIAGLKAEIADKDDDVKNAVLDRLSALETLVRDISSNEEFEDFKRSLEGVLNDISNGSNQLKDSLSSALQSISRLNDDFKSLDINSSFQNMSSNIVNASEDVKEKISAESNKLSQMFDVNVTRTLNDIASNAEVLNSRLKESQTAMSQLCEKSFADVTAGLSGLKDVVAQLDENNVSANNAIFSNITDRLAIFENSLKNSLEKQEDFVSGSSNNVIEQIAKIKSAAEGIEYKLDANAIEIGNAKHEFNDLANAVNKVLAFDFAEEVKNFKTELYASKEDLSSAIDLMQNELSEKVTNDLFGKYELLVSKLDNVEDELKYAQKDALNGLNAVLSNISSSIVDILSYVSAVKEANNDAIEAKLSEVTTFIQDNNLNYIESVRDVVDVVRVQVEEYLNRMGNDSNERFAKISSAISETGDFVRKDIKITYDKLQEVHNDINSINDIIGVNNANITENVNTILTTTENLKGDFDYKLESLKAALLDKVTEFKNDFTCENADNLSELKFSAENIHAKTVQHSIDLKNELRAEIAGIIEALKLNILGLGELVSNTTLRVEGANKEVVDFVRNDFTAEVNNSIDGIKTNTADVLSEIDNKVVVVVNGFNSLENSVNALSREVTTALSGTLAKILDNFVSLNSAITSLDEHSAEIIKENADELKKDFDSLKKKLVEVDSQIDEDLARQVSIIEGSFESLNLMLVDIMNQATDSLGEKIRSELKGASDIMGEKLADELEQYKVQIEELFEGVQGKSNEQAEFIKNCTLELNNLLESTLVTQNKEAVSQLEDIGFRLRDMVRDSLELTSADYENLKEKLNEFTERIERHNNVLVDTIKSQLDDVVKFVDSNLDVQAQEINSSFEEISSSIQNVMSAVQDFNTEFGANSSDIKNELAVLKPEVLSLNNKIQTLFDDGLVELSMKLDNFDSNLSVELTNGIKELKDSFNSLSEQFDKDELSRMDMQQALFSDLNNKFNELVADLKSNSKDNFNSIMAKLDFQTQERNQTAQTLESSINEAISQIENTKQSVAVCKDLISNLVKEHSEIITKNIERETDVIVGEIIEQFETLKDNQKDDVSNVIGSIEGSVSGYIIDAVNDLKSYMDIRTDNTIIDSKLDALRNELTKSVDETTENINKLLQLSVFTDSITDLRTTNEVLLETMTEKINTQIKDFVKENVTKKFDEKLNILDKRFIDTVVDKYEEVKVLSTEYKKSFEKIAMSVSELVSKFTDSKNEINSNITNLVSGISGSIDELKSSFASLKAQIMNKSFDEAFHASVRNQILGIENLVKEQMGYVEDISELCCTNLPELTEMNTLVKHGILQSVNDLKAKLGESGENVSKELNMLKADIISQFVNIFNQISFVAEQEEIIDFIDEKHAELITILSHIVTTTDDVAEVKDNLAVVDNKIDSIKEDIDLINEKITSIMSSEGDIDYVYSLQDLESDIANLRLVLNDMKADNKSKEFEELINSTNNIYNIVETIKSELPKFEAEEFKKDFNNLAEDIVSISTRTNKLILTSDESYKTLQDNLQDFKLVIDDLDERTRNFAHEAGIDKLDTKLCAINTMIQNGAKTNQVFNQVFEYLAEWVDKAGEQISAISDKVETLDDIGQIKVMLEDLRAESHDSTEGAELVEALENIFAKQSKRMASLEAKLDKIIVDSNVKKGKNDKKPIEDALNNFLSKIEDKMIFQQEKINSLETKLEEVVSLVDNKDTAQLTKKVGGMDKQLAKLNKSIEKIASNVVEK